MARPMFTLPTRLFRARAGIAAAVAMAGLLAGCSAPTPGNQTSSSSATVTSPSVAATTSAPTTTPPVVQGVAHIKDGDGYTFDVTYALTPVSYTKDVASEKPGYNAIRIAVRASLTVTNTTAGRTISFQPVTGVINGEPMVELEAYWPRSSVMCAALKATIYPRCSLKMAFTRPGTELNADATSTAETFAGFLGIAPGVAHVPDASYDAVLAALKHPAGYAITYTGYDNDRFNDTCPAQKNDVAIPIFDTSGACGATSPLSQPANA